MVVRTVGAGVLALLILVAASGAARADDDDDDPPTPWDQGSISLSIVLASEQSFDDSYFLVGAGLGYFVLDGLELGLEGVQWFGGDPSVTVVRPEVRYVGVPLGWPLLPYVGGFYTHYFVGEPFADLDTVGARLGAVFHQGGGFVIGAGAVAERIVSDCEGDCTSIYPEVSVGFTFGGGSSGR